MTRPTGDAIPYLYPLHRQLDRRIRRYSSHALYITTLVVGSICLLSLVPGPHRARPDLRPSLIARNIGALDQPETLSSGPDCHLVRKASDQCSFVRTHCPDEEAGLFSYLQLYYCNLPNAKPVALAIIVLWLGMLFSTIGIAASDFFCVNLSTIASLLGMSESLAGVTFLAFGNGSPDVFSTFAAMGSKSGSLAVGELIGAAGFITAVVAGSMAMVRPFKVAKRSFVRDVGFFILAAAFSLVFLKDGKLYLWECILMVGFYVFYVAFVVAWHWWLGRRKRRRQKDALARDHFTHGVDIEPIEEYHDDEDLPASGRPSGTSRATTETDLAVLEQGATDWSDELSEVGEDTRERMLGEISSNMRLRPPPGRRRGTLNPIRPSLVGALEFRSVISGLQKSRSSQSIPISLRRYSDDPHNITSQHSDQLSTISDPPVRSQYEVAAEYGAPNPNNSRFLDVNPERTTRARSVSANAADALRFDPEGLQRPSISLAPLNESENNGNSRTQSILDGNDSGPDLLKVPSLQAGQSRQSIQVSVSPPAAQTSSKPPSIGPPQNQSREGPSLLVPPLGEFYGSSGRPDTLHKQRSVSPGTLPTEQSLSAPNARDAQASDTGKTQELPKLQIPGQGSQSGRSSPASPFPLFSDDTHRLRSRSSTLRSRASSFQLPPPADGRHTLEVNGNMKNEGLKIPPRWWPTLLPSPYAIGTALFPTLRGWREKNIWEKALGIVAAPSVFGLAITLPVVEAERSNLPEEDSRIPTLSLPPTPYVDNHNANKSNVTILEPGFETEDDVHTHEDDNPATPYKTLGGHGNLPSMAVSAERLHNHARHPSEFPLLSPSQPRQLESPEQIPSTPTAIDSNEDKDWNRWLLMVHCFTSPLFCVLIIYANFYDNLDWTPKTLLKMSLYTCIGSLLCLAIVLTTSTPTHAPQWRSFLSFAGFCVSIAWISTIANEVVGVLKAVGVILNMSDAILGLTVFAVGSSLGDFVANVTVARIGFPMMALSACFGGPMLNILLGIGLSGIYFTVKHARDKQQKHPDDPMKFKPFHVHVSGTLLISGATLLFTLVVLLILVPMRKWKMDRVVGITIIGIWVASTIASVVIEVLGLSDEIGPG